MCAPRWTGVTVSKEQLAEATARVKAAGLSDRITLLFCDYRWALAWTGGTWSAASCLIHVAQHVANLWSRQRAPSWRAPTPDSEAPHGGHRHMPAMKGLTLIPK